MKEERKEKSYNASWKRIQGQMQAVLVQLLDGKNCCLQKELNHKLRFLVSFIFERQSQETRPIVRSISMQISSKRND